MTRRWLGLLGAVALGVALSGCAGDESPPSNAGEDDELARQRSYQTRLIENARAVCAVGERPDYFVPAPPDSRLALLGCARLGVTGKRVEFSGNLQRIEGERHACINPAYSGRGQRGLFIPAICIPEPALSRFAVRDAGQPRQGVRGYAYVIWGTAGTSTEVVAHFVSGRAEAAVFRVDPGVARNFGAAPFTLFVMEVPLSAACAPVTVAGNGPDATERITPQIRKERADLDGQPDAACGERGASVVRDRLG